MPDSDPTAETFVDRPLLLRMRPDLMVRELWYRGQKHWTVKDPLALTFFHFSEMEFAVLKLLDGCISLRNLQQAYERRFAPLRLELPKVQAFLSQLHQQGLVVADAAGQGEQLHIRGVTRRRQQWWQQFGNPLAIRLRGINPQRWLGWFTPAFGRLFSVQALLAWLATVCAALILVGSQWELLSKKLPTSQAFFDSGNAWLLMATFVVVKFVHELGHAAACRKYGGQCHELGVQFLAFVPCLYCDVTDAWLLPIKWQRIAISAAGMYVELWLAAITTFLWWQSEPGLLNSLCLNVMVVSSIGTVVFNANPLLRYDGYYILSDLIESPNLEARSRRSLARIAARWLLGVESPSTESFVDERSGWLPLYALAASAYRLFVLFAIYFFLVQLLEPLHVAFLADGVLAVVSLGATLRFVLNTKRLLSEPTSRRQLRGGRISFTLATTLVAVAAFIFWPLPHHVRAPLLLELQAAQRVYVTVPGTLLEAVEAGEMVTAGQAIARLENPDLRREIVKLAGERSRQKLYLEFLKSKQGDDPKLAAMIPATNESLADLDERISQLQQQTEQLCLRAPQVGKVFRPDRSAAPTMSELRLATWDGTPLDAQNRGSYLAAGTLLCAVGDPGRLEAVAVIDQAQVELIQAHMSVTLRLNSHPGHELRGTVRNVARIKLAEESQPFVAAGLLPANPHPNSRSQPLGTSYQVRIQLEESQPDWPPSSFGECKISTPPQSLGTRLIRYLSRTFRFRCWAT